MKVILAGGSGFIGSEMARRLLDAGHSVVVLTRSANAARGRVDARAEVAEWDARSAGPWETAMDGAGAVINLTGESLAAKRWTAEQKRLLRASRIESTTAIVRAIEKAAARPAVLLNASSVGYYGPHGDETLGEDAPPGRDFPAVLCEEWEATARTAESLGVRVVLLRIGIVLDEGGGMLQRLLPLFRMGLGGPLGSGRQWIPWVHRDDTIGLAQVALENDALSGPINITAPEPVTNAEFSRTLGRVLGRPAFLPAPSLALRLVFGELGELLLTGQRVEPRAALRLGYPFRFPQLDPALRAILGK